MRESHRKIQPKYGRRPCCEQDESEVRKDVLAAARCFGHARRVFPSCVCRGPTAVGRCGSRVVQQWKAQRVEDAEHAVHSEHKPHHERQEEVVAAAPPPQLHQQKAMEQALLVGLERRCRLRIFASSASRRIMLRCVWSSSSASRNSRAIPLSMTPMLHQGQFLAAFHDSRRCCSADITNPVGAGHIRCAAAGSRAVALHRISKRSYMTKPLNKPHEDHPSVASAI